MPGFLTALLGLLAGLYSIYLIYLGLPVLMKCPPDKAAGYTAVVIVCAIVAMVVLSWVSAFALPGRGFGGLMGGRAMTLATPDGEVAIDTSRMQEAAKKMDEVRQRMEASQKSGDASGAGKAVVDPTAAGKALGDMMSAMTGTSGVPIAAQDLKALLPETLGSLKRESFEASGGQAVGIASSTAKASYADGVRHVQLTITDLGGLAGMATMAGWANMTVDKETQDSTEKVYKQAGRTIHEESRKDGSHAEYTVILGNGVIVEATGDKVDLGALKTMAAAVDLDAVEALKRTAKT
jgi:hypothetical protein